MSRRERELDGKRENGQTGKRERKRAGGQENERVGERAGWREQERGEGTQKKSWHRMEHERDEGGRPTWSRGLLGGASDGLGFESSAMKVNEWLAEHVPPEHLPRHPHHHPHHTLHQQRPPLHGEHGASPADPSRRLPSPRFQRPASPSFEYGAIEADAQIYRADGFSPAPHTRTPVHGAAQTSPDGQLDWGGGLDFLRNFSPLPLPLAAPHPFDSGWQVWRLFVA